MFLYQIGEKSEYGRYIYQKYSSYKNICLAGPFYNIDELQTLRKWANYYIHGHSAGGTNPTLVEAMWSKLPIIAFIIFLIGTPLSQMPLFSDDKELRSILMSIKESQNLDKNTEKSMNIAISDYSWGKVARECRAYYDKRTYRHNQAGLRKIGMKTLVIGGGRISLSHILKFYPLKKLAI